MGGIRMGVLKGVWPLHGVTGATRRHEGAGPLWERRALAARLRMPTPSASLRPGYGWQGQFNCLTGAVMVIEYQLQGEGCPPKL